MTSIRGEIATPRASRYLVQLCSHAAAIAAGDHPLRPDHAGAAGRPTQLRAEWDDARGVLDFGAWGRAVLTADDAGLTVRIEASDDASLRAVQGTISRDLERFGRREQLQVIWQSAPAP